MIQRETIDRGSKTRDGSLTHAPVYYNTDLRTVYIYNLFYIILYSIKIYMHEILTVIILLPVI